MYTKFVKHNGNQFVNLQGVLNNKPYYNFNLGKDGKLYNENFKVSSKKEIEADSYKNLPHKERGWCEWAVGSLCGTGGAGGCWASCFRYYHRFGWLRYSNNMWLNYFIRLYRRDKLYL